MTPRPPLSPPVCVDLYCGLGGWSEGFLEEGYDCLGFDIERHDYGNGGYPGQLVLQDVTTLHGSQFRDAAIIVASPPCQAYSYRAMPWKRAKALPPPDNTLFDACFRIQREACEAAGRHIPLIVENVCGAQKWVGRAKWHFGSFYLWGDVPALMPITNQRAVLKEGVTHRSDGTTNFHGRKTPIGNCSNPIWKDREVARYAHPTPREAELQGFADGVKVGGLNWSDRSRKGQAFNTHAERMTKNSGGSWFNVAHNTTSGKGQNPDGRKAKGTEGIDESLGVKGFTVKRLGENQVGRASWSTSPARKRASAEIAKIPFTLSQHIARWFYPVEREAAR